MKTEVKCLETVEMFPSFSKRIVFPLQGRSQGFISDFSVLIVSNI